MALPFDTVKKVKGEHAKRLYRQITNPEKDDTRGKVLAEAREIRRKYYRE